MVTESEVLFRGLRTERMHAWGARMSLLGFRVLVVIAAGCDAIRQALVGYSVGGCLISSVVGLGAKHPGDG